MNKRIKKIKIRKGKDATESVVRKLVVNFITHGKITTTVKRAKIIRSEIDRLVHKAKDKKQSSIVMLFLFAMLLL